MTIQDAAAMVTVQQAQDRIMQDPTLNLWGKVKSLESINRAARATPQRQPWVTPGSVVRGAIGAGVGYRLGDVIGRYLGLEESTAQDMRRVGLGLGTLFNAEVGKMKTASSPASDEETDIRNAVMLGFLKGARETGLLDNPRYCATGLTKKVAYVAVTPDVFTAPVRTSARAASGAAATAGSLGAHVLGEDAADVDVQRMLLEKRKLEMEADRLRAQRQNRVLQRVLQRRLNAIRADV